MVASLGHETVEWETYERVWRFGEWISRGIDQDEQRFLIILARKGVLRLRRQGRLRSG